MRYVSTRGQSAPQGFADILLAGLAPDGGLFLPESWSSDPARMKRVRVPADRQAFHSKPEIAIDEIDRVRAEF